MAQKATSLGKFLRNLLKNRLCCRFFKTLPLNETAPSFYAFRDFRRGYGDTDMRGCSKDTVKPGQAACLKAFGLLALFEKLSGARALRE